LNKSKQKRQFLIILLKSNLPDSIKTKVKFVIDEIFSSNPFQINYGINDEGKDTVSEFESFIKQVKKAGQNPFWKIQPSRIKNHFIPLENSIDELVGKIEFYKESSNSNEFQLINIVSLYQMIEMKEKSTKISFTKYLDYQVKYSSYSESYIFIIVLMIIRKNFSTAIKYLNYFPEDKSLSFNFNKLFFSTQLIAICDMEISEDLYQYYREVINSKIFKNKSLIDLATSELIEDVKIEFNRKLTISKLNTILKSTIRTREKINKHYSFYNLMYEMCEITGTGNIFLEILIRKIFSNYNIENHIFTFDPYSIVSNSMQELIDIYRLCVNNIRDKNGLPKIGEGWISETKLYYQLKNHYTSHKVQQHSRPDWLKPQHLDIYFPELNIGVEYQGQQHFQSIEFFGGEEGLKKTQERDKRKKKICKQNECPLIYVYPDYDIDDLIMSLDNEIEKIRS
jgi:hypothetical protein